MERTLTLTVEDALLSPISFAMLSGAGLTNVSNAAQDNKIYQPVQFDLPILKGGIVKLDYDTCRDSHDIYVSDNKGQVFGTILDNAGAGVVFTQLVVDGISGVEGNCVEGDTDNGHVYTISDNDELVFKFEGADKYVGKTMRVDCYCQRSSGATEITIDSENFAGDYYVEASTLFRDQYTKKDMPAVFVVPDAKIQSNFTFTMANSGDPSKVEYCLAA